MTKTLQYSPEIDAILTRVNTLLDRAYSHVSNRDFVTARRELHDVRAGLHEAGKLLKAETEAARKRQTAKAATVIKASTIEAKL